MIAFDARGNQSLRSEPASITTGATTAAVTCEVKVQTYGQFSGSQIKLINSTRAHEAAIQPGELLVVGIGTGGNAAAVAPSNFTLDGAPCTVL